jgi:pantetheine-phosphate adenylyltransferase
MVILAVAEDNYKDTLFDIDERVRFLTVATEDLANVRIEKFSGLLIDFVNSKGACAIVRGLRALSDFEYEFQLSIMNKKLSDKVETMFLMTSSEYAFLSSSIIKQVAALGGCIRGLVPEMVEKSLPLKFNKPKKA